jgi:hypothetical protein
MVALWHCDWGRVVVGVVCVLALLLEFFDVNFDFDFDFAFRNFGFGVRLAA